jgi:hypothetical protein
MVTDKIRKVICAAAVAGAVSLAPVALHAQTADTTATANYGAQPEHSRGFNWGWLGLLGLLGLWPKSRKETITTTDTRNTTTGTRH